MPSHRKPTHRPRFLAAALMVMLTGSGVAFAGQAVQESISSAPEPGRVTDGPPSPTSPTVPIAEGERIPRPSRTAGGQRVDVEKRATDRPTATREPKATRKPSESPSPTERAPETTSTPASTGKATGPVSVILRDTGTARANAGLPGLDVDSCLARLAQRHAERLAAARSLYHQEMGPVMNACGLAAAGENVAMNYSGPSDMVAQWLESPGHRANLLSSRFSLIGVGVAQARDGAWYGVQVFGD